jgi:hypothetical protein
MKDKLAAEVQEAMVCGKCELAGRVLVHALTCVSMCVCVCVFVHVCMCVRVLLCVCGQSCNVAFLIIVITLISSLLKF